MDWLDDCPPRFRAPLERCARGDAPANVVVMRLHAEASSPEEVATVLAGVGRRRVPSRQAASPGASDAGRGFDASTSA
jgi:hypothetical protein